MLKKIVLAILLLAVVINPLWIPIADIVCRGRDQPIEVVFSVKEKARAPELGMPDTLRDTGIALVYVPRMNVYYLTKKDGDPVRFDGEYFTYEYCYVLCRY